MTREKKTMRRGTRKLNEEVKQTLAEKNSADAKAAQFENTSNTDLFAVNTMPKTGVREKLRADRFARDKNRGVSHVDTILKKRLRNQASPAPKHLAAKDEFEEYGDLWGSAPSK